MGWDSAAVLMIDIATSIGLLEHSMKGEAITEDSIKNTEDRICDQVAKKYWMKKASKSLGDFLYRERDEKFANEIKENVFEIKNRIMAALKDEEIDETKKQEKLKLCKESLACFLQHMKDTNGGKLPNRDLELYLKKLLG